MKLIATPQHDIQFMHNLQPVTAGDMNTLYQYMEFAMREFRYIEHKPTGEPLPETMVYPEIKWHIKEVEE